jgi:hypothetical protein
MTCWKLISKIGKFIIGFFDLPLSRNATLILAPWAQDCVLQEVTWDTIQWSSDSHINIIWSVEVSRSMYCTEIQRRLRGWNFIWDESHHGPPSHQEKGENAQHGYLPDRIRPLKMKPKNNAQGWNARPRTCALAQTRGYAKGTNQSRRNLPPRVPQIYHSTS